MEKGNNGEQILILEGILRVIVPVQKVSVTLSLQHKRLTQAALRMRTENFTPIRLLANFWFADAETKTAVTYFDPPLTMEVDYNIFDLYQAALVYQPLKLAYLQEKTWVVLNATAERFKLLPPGENDRNIAQVDIASWPADPIAGWGT